MRTCEVSRFEGTMEVGNCNIDAVAKWGWGGDPLYVCEHHDAWIRESDEFGTRTALDADTGGRDDVEA